MTGSAFIRYMLKESNTTTKALAERMDCDYQVLRNKLYRDNFRFDEIVLIANLLGFEVQAIKK